MEHELNLEIKKSSVNNMDNKLKIEIQVELMASIKRPNNIPRISNHIFSSSISIRKLLLQLGYDPITDILTLITYVNKERVRLNYILNNGDYLFITIPIGGG